MKVPNLDKIYLLDSKTNLKPSLHSREPLTRFFLMVGTCCTFFSCTVFPEVNFRFTIPTPRTHACDPVGTPGLGYPLLLCLGKDLVVILNYIQTAGPLRSGVLFSQQRSGPFH